jgi:hypothetical protein
METIYEAAIYRHLAAALKLQRLSRNLELLPEERGQYTVDALRELNAATLSANLSERAHGVDSVRMMG